MALTTKRGDTRRAPVVTLKTPKGNPVNLKGASVNFIMKRYQSGTILIDRTAYVLDAEAGRVCYVFSPEEADVLGMMKVSFRVTYSDRTHETFPNQGYIIIEFEE